MCSHSSSERGKCAFCNTRHSNRRQPVQRTVFCVYLMNFGWWLSQQKNYKNDLLVSCAISNQGIKVGLTWRKWYLLVNMQVWKFKPDFPQVSFLLSSLQTWWLEPVNSSSDWKSVVMCAAVCPGSLSKGVQFVRGAQPGAGFLPSRTVLRLGASDNLLENMSAF